MAQLKIGRPKQDVRMRNWSRGRLASLKLMITRIEEALDRAGASPIEESAARRFDDLVPFILDLDLDAGYRQYVMNFSTPPGLGGTHPNRQLIFYEIQHDATAAFNNPTIIETPERHIIIGGVGTGETRFFRARTINTKFHASRWSKTVPSTTAQGVFQLTDIQDISVRLIEPVGVFQELFTFNYDPFNGAQSLNLHLAVGALQTDQNVIKDSDNSIIKTFNSGPAFVQFRVLHDTEGDSVFKEFGQRTILSARPGWTGKGVGKHPMAFGTLVSEYVRLGNNAFNFRLEAAKLPGGEWRGGEGTETLKQSDPLVFLRRGKVLEILENL